MSKGGQKRKFQKCPSWNILEIFQKSQKLHVLKNTKIMVFRCLHRHDHDDKHTTTVVSTTQESPCTAPWDVGRVLMDTTGVGSSTHPLDTLGGGPNPGSWVRRYVVKLVNLGSPFLTNGTHRYACVHFLSVRGPKMQFGVWHYLSGHEKAPKKHPFLGSQQDTQKCPKRSKRVWNLGLQA